MQTLIIFDILVSINFQGEKFMAKKTQKTTTTTTHSTSEKTQLIKFCAFWSMAIAALTYIFSGILSMIIKLMKDLNAKTAGTLSQIINIANFLGSVALIIAIALPAYNYVRGKSKSWKIFYWICLVVFALGVVLCMLPGLW